jgi:purine-binding chemotaxis protein CheW
VGLSLICRVRSRSCALPLDHVIETMRPLPVVALSGTPFFVRGVSIIRGVAVPVLDVARLLGAEEIEPGRFVTVRAAGRVIAIAVDDVIGVRTLPASTLAELPPLLRDAGAETIAALGVLDDGLLLVLRSARLLSDAAWATIDEATASP